VLTVAARAAPFRCFERPTSTFLRATKTTLTVTANSTVDTDMSTVPRRQNTVPKRPSMAHTEHSHKSVHPWPTASKTKQVRFTCGHQAGRTVEAWSCGNKYSVHFKVEMRGACRNTLGVRMGGHTGWESVGWNVSLALRSAPRGNPSTALTRWEGMVWGMSRNGTRAKEGEGVGRKSSSVLRER